MSCSIATRITSLITAVTLTGCASANTYSRVEAESVHVTANYKGETPPGIVEDAMSLNGSAPLFDAATYAKLENAAKSDKDLATAQRNIRDTVCNGSEPRVQPTLKVHLILNKPPKGEPLDIVAEKNRIFISETKIFLKKVWLDEASRTDFIGKDHDTDYEDYYRHMVQTGMERRSSSSLVTVGVPFLPVSSAKEVEAYFANAQAIPTLRPIEETGPTEWFPARSYVSVALPNHAFVLTSKISDLLLTTWGYANYGTEMRSSVIRNVQFKPETTFQNFGISDGFNWRSSSFYGISKSEWKLKDGTIAHPLIKTVMDDLAILKSSFSWRIPKADLARLFHETDDAEFQYWGYDGDKYSAALALQHQSLMWSRMLESQTQITQTSKEDSTVLYEVRPGLAAFCKWAVPTTALTAE